MYAGCSHKLPHPGLVLTTVVDSRFASCHQGECPWLAKEETILRPRMLSHVRNHAQKLRFLNATSNRAVFLSGIGGGIRKENRETQSHVYKPANWPGAC